MDYDKKIYQYSEIKSIDIVTKTKNRFKKNMFVEILFKDGNIWNSANTEDLSNEQAKLIADYLAQKTNLQISHKVIKRPGRDR